jgi:hypothetical protein
MYESDNVVIETDVEPELVPSPAASGKDQLLARCPKCKVCVWSHYGGFMAVKFVRTGTVDPECREGWGPDVHIYTGTKMDWVQLGDKLPAFEEYYDRNEVWSKQALKRREKLIEKLGLQAQAAKAESSGDRTEKRD